MGRTAVQKKHGRTTPLNPAAKPKPIQKTKGTPHTIHQAKKRTRKGKQTQTRTRRTRKNAKTVRRTR